MCQIYFLISIFTPMLRYIFIVLIFFWCFWTVVLERTQESLGLQGDQTSQSWRKSILNIHWKDWCWGWSSNTLATRCKELTHWKRPQCWERLKAGGEGDNRGWDGWMASSTRWTWVWAGSWSWWGTGKTDVLQSMVSQRVRHDWATELNWSMGKLWGETEVNPGMSKSRKERYPDMVEVKHDPVEGNLSADKFKLLDSKSDSYFVWKTNQEIRHLMRICFDRSLNYTWLHSSTKSTETLRSSNVCVRQRKGDSCFFVCLFCFNC